MAIETKYTAVVKSVGGRGGGTAKSADGAIDFKIGSPKALGGNDDGINPDQLFAAGYSTCYLGAMKFVAGKEAKPLKIAPESSVTAHVSFGPRDDKQGFGISVKLEVSLPGLSKAEAQALADKAHIVCPYSHAIRNNVEVTTEIL